MNNFNIRNKVLSFFLLSLLLSIAFPARSQVTVYTVQGFNFGTFYQGNTGGTVDISTTGSRTATGDIILMNTGAAPSQAIFDIETPAGSFITIGNGPDATLTGSNGGTLNLHIGNSDPGSPFNTTAVPPDRTRIQIGGTLTIGDRTASPPGIYQGTFSITFYQE